MPETLEQPAASAAIHSSRQLLAAMALRLGEIGGQWRLVLRIAALVSFANVVFYVLFVYLVDFSGHQVGSSLGQANATSTVIQTLGLPLVVLGGVLVDRYGQVPVNRFGNLLLAFITPVALPLVQLGGPMGRHGIEEAVGLRQDPLDWPVQPALHAVSVALAVVQAALHRFPVVGAKALYQQGAHHRLAHVGVGAADHQPQRFWLRRRRGRLQGGLAHR